MRRHRRVIGWVVLAWAVGVGALGYWNWRAMVRQRLGSALVAAAKVGDCDRARSLLQRGADVAFPARAGDAMEGFTPLTAAAYSHQADMVRLLVAYGANPNTGGAGSSSLCAIDGPPLYVASWQDAAPGGGETAVALIECGADPCYRPEPWVPSPLEMAARHSAREQVRVLLDAGAPANARSPTGWTPLLLACLGGVHVEHTDPERLAEVVSMLLEAGADPAAAGVAPAARPAGLTALHYAAETGSLSPAEELLSCGANPLVRDGAGETAAELAERQGHSEVVALLRAAERSATSAAPPESG